MYMVIEDEARNLALWDEQKIYRNGRAYHTDNCPPGTKEYLHPVFGKSVRYIQSRHAYTKFDADPKSFASMGEYRKAWKKHRESSPIIARVLDECLIHYGVTLAFKRNHKNEFDAWLQRMKRYTLDVASGLITLRSSMTEDDAASFRKFSGAVKQAGLSYPNTVIAIYDTLWPYRSGNHEPRRSLSPWDLHLLKAVEGDFAKTVFAEEITDSEYARVLIRKIAAKMSDAFRGVTH